MAAQTTPDEAVVGAQDTGGWHIDGMIPRRSIAALYKVGLATVALAMLVLPLIYIALIAATAYAVIHHAIDPWFPIQGSGVGALMQYVGPLIVGTILVFFMVKPFFARRAKAREPMVLTPSEEPELFRFIDAICDLVRAPRPGRVAIDMEVNASASFRRGFRSFVGRDLVLTIGLPVVAGLNISQFGGVLAHELGHFAQGAGMRLTYVVRATNAWFARVVYERDEWDERLRRATTRYDFRLRFIFHLARGSVWLTRWVLWALMWVGHGISCFMLRQMEFDADWFETQVAGTEAFVATTRRMTELGIAQQRTIALQDEALHAKRLVNDLPRLIARATAHLPRAARDFIDESLSASKTSWWNTHPSNRDRIAASERIDAAGVLRGESIASTLFHDFAQTAEQRTRIYYENECGIALGDIFIDEIERMASEAEIAAEEDASAARWFGPLLTIRTMVIVTPEEIEAARVQTNTGPQNWDATRETIEALLKADADEMTARNARALIRAVFVVKPKDWGLKRATAEGAEEAIAAAANRAESERAKLAQIIATTRRRFAAALAGNGVAQNQTQELTQLLARFAPLPSTLLALRNSTGALELLLINSERATNGSAWNLVAQGETDTIERCIDDVMSSIGDRRFPFPHARGEITVAEFLDEPHQDAQRIPRAFLRGRAVLNRSWTLYQRVMRRLAFIAELSNSE